MTKIQSYDEWVQIPAGDNCNDFYEAFSAGWDSAMKSLEKPKDKVPYSAILSTMNSILLKNFGPTQSNCRHIRARWNEGMREPDFELVARIKNLQWKDDPQMAIYLRPETLYGTKMESYKNEPIIKKVEIEEWQ